MKNKNKVIYTDLLEEYTLLGLKSLGRDRYEVFIEYREPNMNPWMDHICDLPEESFEINDKAIAVFGNVKGKVRLRDVYDLELHKFVVKDKVVESYKKNFKGAVKVKQKVG